MLKVIHTADVHFDNKKAILDEVVRCSTFLAEYAESNRPDAVLITGDLVDQRLYMDSPGALAALAFIKRIAATCPCLVVKGTELHDFDSLKALRGLPNVMVVDDVRQVCFSKSLGFYEKDDPNLPEGYDPMCDADMVVSCLPSLSKAFLISLGRDGDTAQEEIQALLGDLMRGWGEVNRELRDQGVVTVVGGHGTVGGAVTSTGQVMIGHDITYSTDDLRAASADAVLFGHIHKYQKVDPAYYCGSLGRLNAGEQEIKGFIVLNLEAGVQATPQFVQTPAREFIVVDLGKDPENWQEELVKQLDGRDMSESTVIKVKTQMSETNAASIVKKDIEGIVGREVMFDKSIIPIQRTRSDGISKLTSLREKYIRWAENSGQPVDEEMLTRVDMLGMAEEVLQEAVLQKFGDDAPKAPAAELTPSDKSVEAIVEAPLQTVPDIPVVKKKRGPRKKAAEEQPALL